MGEAQSCSCPRVESVPSNMARTDAQGQLGGFMLKPIFKKLGKPGAQEEALIAVTSSALPYLYDVPHLLSLPDGFEFRFRYRRQWIDPPLLNAIEARPRAFERMPFIILFHSLETGVL